MNNKNWDPVPVKSILSNLELIFKSKDIYKLNKIAYNFIMNVSGFIAHYDLYGFQNEYQDLRTFIHDILISSDITDPEREVRDSWFQNQYGLPYCQSKTDVYKGMKKLALQYQSDIENHFSFQQTDKEMNIANIIAQKHGYKLVKNEKSK